MSTRLDRFHQRPRRTPAAVLACVGALTLVACDQAGEAETAVRDASIVLTTGAESDLTSRGSGAESPEAFRIRRLEAALASLAPHAGDEGSAYGGAAAVLAAIAENGLGVEHESAFITARRELDNRATVLRGTLAQWWKRHALAEASSTFDPSEALAELDRLGEMLARDIEQVRQAKAALDEQIASLESQIAQAQSRANEERNEAARIQLEANRATPEERPMLAERVREHTRRADSYEFQAQRLETRASQIRPDAAEKAKHIERLRRQLELLDESREQIRDQERMSADDAAAARRAARETGAALFEGAAELNDYLTNDLSELAGTCERHLRGAINHARSADESARSSASLANAAAQHRLGDLHKAMSQAHASVGDFFVYLGSLPLENAARFTELGQQRLESAEQARASADEAYASAARALRSVRVRGDARDALSALADRLEGVEPESSDEFGTEQPGGASDDDPTLDDAADQPAPESDDGG